jgi:hypothetical protein
MPTALPSPARGDTLAKRDLFLKPKPTPGGLIVLEFAQSVNLDRDREQALAEAGAAGGVPPNPAACGDNPLVPVVHLPAAQVQLIEPNGIVAGPPKIRDRIRHQHFLGRRPRC